MVQARTTHVVGGANAWSAVYAIALGAFALVTSEFMPVSLLTPIASDLHVSEGQAGQAISVSGVLALLTSLSLSKLAGKVDRKHLLLGLMLLTIISGTISALAPNYATFMIGRAFIGIALGGFWSMSTATAMRLVSQEHIPRALAVINGGNALATVIAAPLGSYLGAMIGWHGAFFCIVPVAIFCLAWNGISLPSMPAASEARTQNPFRLLRQPSVAFGMGAVCLFFMGQFTLFTYLRPFLEQLTHGNTPTISGILFLIGAAGFAGTALIGSLLKTQLYRVLAIIPLAMAAIAIVLVACASMPVAATAMLGIWGLVATSAPVGWWTWLAGVLPKDAEVAGGLMVAVVQLAIAGGATVGGILFDVRGYSATFALSAVLLCVSALLTTCAARVRTAPLSSPMQK